IFDYQIQADAEIVGLQHPIKSEGDFFLCAFGASAIIQLRPDSQINSGDVAIRLTDDTGYRLSNDYLGMDFTSAVKGNAYHYTYLKSHLFKAGTKIIIDLKELADGTIPGPITGLPTNVQIAFYGVYRYRSGK